MNKAEKGSGDCRHQPLASACTAMQMHSQYILIYMQTQTHTYHMHMKMEKVINKYKICLDAKFYDYGIGIKLYGSTN